MGDRRRHADAVGAQRAVQRHHARVLAVLRCGRERRGVAHVGRRQLWQGATVTADARGSRCSAVPVPERAGGARTVTVLPADDVIALSEGALMQARMGDAEAVVTSVTEELTRFAANAIHQNVAERSLRLRARVLADNRVGTAASTGEAGANLAARVMAAAESAREVATQTDVSPIPEPDEGADDPAAYSAATAAATPELRADHVAAIARRASGRGLVAYGYLSTAQRQTAVANTKGVRRSATSTQAGAVVVVRGDAGSGYASRHDADIDRIDIEEMADEAVDTCLRNQGADAIEPGTYEVVLAPYAVTDLLEHLGWVGFSALAVQEHRSFMRIGEKAMSE